MSNINYEEEVKKVYPLARCEWYILQEGGLKFFVFQDNASNKPCLNEFGCETEPAAWQSAYQTLKQQGKIK